MLQGRIESRTTMLTFRRGKNPRLLWSVKILAVLLCQVISAAETPANSDVNSYPRRERLADPNDLVSPSTQSKRVILDARDKDKYLTAHAPNAVWIDAAEWAKAATQDNDTNNWTRRFASAGIDQDSEVIVYDDQRLRSAARVWWILRLWGVTKARVLNGGWDAYVESKQPTETGNRSVSNPGSFVAQLEEKVLATKEQVMQTQPDGKQSGASSKLQLVDTRSKAEFCGTDPSRSKRVGTVPGAKNLEWSDLLVADSSRLKSPAELRSLFERTGIDLSKPTASFCQGGGRASVTAFVLDVMGASESRNYYRGWGEWGTSDDTPIVKGQPN